MIHKNKQIVFSEEEKFKVLYELTLGCVFASWSKLICSYRFPNDGNCLEEIRDVPCKLAAAILSFVYIFIRVPNNSCKAPISLCLSKVFPLICYVDPNSVFWFRNIPKKAFFAHMFFIRNSFLRSIWDRLVQKSLDLQLTYFYTRQNDLDFLEANHFFLTTVFAHRTQVDLCAFHCVTNSVLFTQ